MSKISFVSFTIIYSLILPSEEFRVQRNIDELSDYYKVELLKNLDSKPIQYTYDSKINELSNRFVYDVTVPNGNDQNYDLLIEKSNESYRDHVIIKSKPKYFDLGPYALIRKLDEIKYMVLWLNLYCGVHPDCDQVKLNEELQKMVSSVVLEKQK